MKRNRHFRWMAYLLCLSLSVLCLGSCQKDFGDDNISDTSLFGGSIGGKPNVTITGPVDWTSGKGNITLRLNKLPSGYTVRWKSSSPDFTVVSGQGTANLVCKFTSTQKPIVIAEIQYGDYKDELKFELKLVHMLHAIKLLDIFEDVYTVGYLSLYVYIKHSINHDHSIPVSYELKTTIGSIEMNPDGYNARLTVYEVGEGIVSCRMRFQDIYSDWYDEYLYVDHIPTQW